TRVGIAVLIYDVVIVGSGIVGATAAIALAKESNLTIAVIETKELPVYQQKEKYDSRVSAISLASKSILQHLALWDAIQSKRVSPYQKMQVWDAKGDGQIHFNCEEIQQPALGFIIEDNVIRTSLLEKFSCYPTLHFLCPINLISLRETDECVELLANDQQLFRAKLVIAADGANSWVRSQANIELKSRDYAHTAIVTTAYTELSHEATAWQRFLPSGPLAFLPLADEHACSIVWSTSPAHAENLLSLDDTTFCSALTDAFDARLGKILKVDARHFFPLRMRHAKNYVKSRIALIGDAAHTVHPLAGQGVNLGLLDAACLVEVILEAHKKNRDFANFATLRRYERWRKGDTLMMLAVVEGLKQLFASEKKWLQTMRNTGLHVTNQLGFLKNALANYAIGQRGDLPKSAFLN
ncbi:MAG TPA: UbiH/UbiF/VisC/COQ6 family ubiquinone biosynthesis hydroxylase, partial [Gammaproteobacteria bacterium]|nr:UbiH/UbiF/VisC/COQ6 family ubiquinone biosynthesis hydroxylase [Gammaproteobacteria bacterium]